jgi:CYTH domain-containing protein
MRVDSADEKAAINPPSWLKIIKEVTGDEQYSSKIIA